MKTLMMLLSFITIIFSAGIVSAYAPIVACNQTVTVNIGQNLTCGPSTIIPVSIHLTEGADLGNMTFNWYYNKVYQQPLVSPFTGKAFPYTADGHSSISYTANPQVLTVILNNTVESGFPQANVRILSTASTPNPSQYSLGLFTNPGLPSFNQGGTLHITDSPSGGVPPYYTINTSFFVFHAVQGSPGESQGVQTSPSSAGIGQDGNNFTFTQTGNYSIQITGADSFGQQFENNVNIQVNPTLTDSAPTASSTSIYASNPGQTVMLTEPVPTTGTPFYSYHWYEEIPGGSSFLPTNASWLYVNQSTKPGVYQFKVVVQDFSNILDGTPNFTSAPVSITVMASAKIAPITSPTTSPTTSTTPISQVTTGPTTAYTTIYTTQVTTVPTTYPTTTAPAYAVVAPPNSSYTTSTPYTTTVAYYPNSASSSNYTQPNASTTTSIPGTYTNIPQPASQQGFLGNFVGALESILTKLFGWI